MVVISGKRCMELLFLVAVIVMLMMIYLPNLSTPLRPYASKLRIFHPPTISKKNKVIKGFYDEKESNEITPIKGLAGSLIVHGVRRPHPAVRSREQRRLNLFQKLLRLRPWPQFSPGPEHQAPEHQSLTNDSSSFISTNIFATSSNHSTSFLLTKDLYSKGHVWSHPELCEKDVGFESSGFGEGVVVVVLVTSLPKNKDRRAAIRLTWGHYTTRADVVLAFMLAQPPSQYLEQLVEEDSIHGDLLMGNIKESFTNATLKTLSLMEWANTFCPQAQTILKTNDDVFVNVPKLISFISAPNRIHRYNTIWGMVIKNVKPERQIMASPYYLSPIEFPSDHLPDFTMGSAYLMTSIASKLLFKAASEKPYLHLENVFITGILADDLGIERVHVNEFFNFNVTESPCAVHNGIVFDNVGCRQQFDLWHKLHDQSLCRIPY